MTHAENNFQKLLFIGRILFLGGTAVSFGAAWVPAAATIYQATPLFVFVVIGQALLAISIAYVIDGIRQNDLCAPGMVLYKVVSGGAIFLSLAAAGPPGGSPVPAFVSGGYDLFLALSMFVFWAKARKSLAERAPSLAAEVSARPERKTDPAGKALRVCLGILAVLWAAAALGFLVLLLRGNTVLTPYYRVGIGKSISSYTLLAFFAFLGSKSMQRFGYGRDIALAGSLVTAILLAWWSWHFHLDPATNFYFAAGALIHGVIAVVLLIISGHAERIRRPTVFFGSWLHRVFAAFAEVIVIEEPPGIPADEIATLADTMLAKVPSRRIQTVKLALLALELAPLLRFRVPLSRMAKLEREAYLAWVHAQGGSAFRDLIKIKQLVFFIYYSDPRTHREIGFTELADRARFKRAERNHQVPTGTPQYPFVPSGTDFDADICVIGTGAGGAVMAATLAEKGLRVLIVEEGPYLKRDQITRNEPEMQAKAYRDGGLQLTTDFDMFVLQGRCVGGSTFLNNGICFSPDEEVFSEWKALGATLDREQLARSYDRIRQSLDIIDLGERQDLLEKGSLKFTAGCRGLGLSSGFFQVNLGQCIGCGYCTSGCGFEKKQSMDLSFIPRALAAGAQLISQCRALRIEHGGGNARIVVCRREDGSPVRIKAGKIVVACGAVGSSLLLERSGITRNVGTRLSFNAATLVFAEFPEHIDGFDGVQMCAYHQDRDFILETFASPPGAFAAAMPSWFLEHFDHMKQYRHYAMAGVLVGTEAVGKVRAFPLPVLRELISPIHFELTISDLGKMKRGIELLSRIFLQAGATRVMPATFQPLEFTHPFQLSRLNNLVLENDDISFGSSHIQGGNPMSDNPEIGVVKSDFRVHGFDNLYVCDASIFPSGIRVNPQLTIMALADYAARQMAGRPAGV